MSEKVRLVSGTCPEHGRILCQVMSAVSPRCPRYHTGNSARDARKKLDHVAPFGAPEWEAARTVPELRACDTAFKREWSLRRNRLAFCALSRIYFANAQQYWLWKAVEIGEVWADTGTPPAEARDLFMRLEGDEFGRQNLGPSRTGEWTWLAVACVRDEEEVPFEFGEDYFSRYYPAPTFDFDAHAESLLAPAPAMVFRELIANPFVPLTWKTDWLTSTVRDFAAHIYESRDFGAMPILADALQDAGCDSEPVLAHCRANKPHARGCWVLDALLGKV